MEIIVPFCSCTVLSRYTKKSVQYFWLAKNLKKRRHPQKEEVTPFLVVWQLTFVRDVYL